MGFVKNLINVQNLSYSIPHGTDILKNLSFELNEGEFLGVLGRNGVGKTTLIDILLGIRPCLSGKIDILGESATLRERTNLSSICFLSQDSILKSTISIAQYLKFYSSLYPNYSIKDEAFYLNYFSLNSADQIGSLSTGQQKKLQAIAAFSSRPKLILIDEITAVLDPETRDQFFKILKHLKEKNGIGVLLATNIAEDLINRADKILYIDMGVGSMKKPSEILNLFNVGKAV